MLGKKQVTKDAEDNIWISAFKSSGDAVYLGFLYEKYKRRVLGYCLQIVKNEEDAKDLASTAFMKAFDHLGEFRAGAPFLPWLKRIALNLCVDHVRRRSRIKFRTVYEQDVQDREDKTEIGEENKQLRRKIRDALRQLKPDQRRCFCLFYLNRLSYREIAEITGYSYNQVRSYIQNGRRKFKILMEKS